MTKQLITIQATVNAPVEKVWHCYNTPADIMQWNHASDDWHCPASNNDLRAGGRFSHTMAAKDGSFQFDFSGKYDDIIPHQSIAYTLDDGRMVKMLFKQKGNQTQIISEFEPEQSNPLDMQQAGWQAILNNFKQYVESKN